LIVLEEKNYLLDCWSIFWRLWVVRLCDIDTLLVCFIQAVGSCAATVAAIAMVRDLFPVKKFRKYSLC
jgi:hypothetical protein